MSDAKSKDVGGHQDRPHEAKPLDTPDAQATREAKPGDIAKVETSRTNPSDGSLRRFNKHLIAAQEHSIELVSGDDVVSRTHRLSEKDLVQSQPPEDCLHALQRVSALPLDQQLKIYSTALGVGAEQYNLEQRQRDLGRLIGTVQGVGDITMSLATVAEFAGDIILNNTDRAAQKGQQFGDALGQTIVGGMRLFHAADQYLLQVGYEGDYSRPFKDIAALGQALDKKWSEFPAQEQERIKAKLVTELVGNALLTKGGASAVSEAKTFTGILDAVAADSKRLYEASKAAGKPAINSLKEGGKQVSQAIQDVLRGPKQAFAGEAAYLDTVPASESSLIDTHALQSRVYTSKLDPRHRLTPIEAAREHTQLKGERFDEDSWKKLTPKEKTDNLTKAGYEMLEDPEPVPPLDSTKMHTAFRGDVDLHAPVDKYGRGKSYLDSDGNLRPVDLSGMFEGRPVAIEEHIISNLKRGAKGHSPFTSVGTEGVLYKFGEGRGLAVDMKALRAAISSGEVKDVQIIEHADLVKHIEKSTRLNEEQRTMALRFINYDGEFLIRDEVPARFIVKWEK